MTRLRENEEYVEACFYLKNLKNNVISRIMKIKGYTLTRHLFIIALFLHASMDVISQATPANAAPSEKILNRSFSQKDVSAFLEPEKVFHPETWFHFIGGNVAKKGITADLEAIAEAGISGIQLFHGQFGGAWPGVTPQIKCLSESWDDAINHTANECRRLGLRFTMQNCPGWAMAGGPWINPENAMRHLAWSRTDITGGQQIAITLPLPESAGEEWRDYRDVTVLAFPVPDGDTGKALIPDSITSNREDQPWEKCIKKEKGSMVKLDPGSEPAWLEVKFNEAVTIRTLQFPSVESFNHGWCYAPGITITVQAVLPDGVTNVAEYIMPQSNWQDKESISLACSEAKSDTYRIIIDHKHVMNIGHMQFFSAARKNNWEGEAAWTLRGLMRETHPVQSKSTWIDPALTTDISSNMNSEGRLIWNAPAGNWTVLRFGHINTGTRNGPAPPEATGWECNKLSPIGAEAHFQGYIGRIASENGPAGKGLLNGMLLDSWECKTQTWTPGMEQLFKDHNSYPMLQWLPALAGYVVTDPETTARFLCDWRSTINNLFVKNFFGRMSELGNKHGLSISFETAAGDVFPADILEYYKYADVPMCEFWHPRSESYVGSFEFKPVKPCVSAARLYGKSRVAAEAFTSFNLSWTEHPGMLKNIADMHLAEGITHLVFHTYTHNPRTDFLPPGTAFGTGIGTPFLRGQTWWKHMPEFTAYLARCGYLLERGRPVSDVLWYIGDEIDHKPNQNAPFPSGYKYDYCNRDILLNRLSVRNGLIMTPEGLSYRLLLLQNCKRMRPETLERLAELVKAGAVLVGEQPDGPATMTGGEAGCKRFNEAVRTLWSEPGKSGERKLGEGRVISGKNLEEVLKEMQIQPDVTGNGVVWLHRQTKDADWYFVAAPEAQGFRGTLGFRASGKTELWNPINGSIKPAGVIQRSDEGTMVALDLPPSGSIFVVFRKEKEITPAIVKVKHDNRSVIDAQSQPISSPAACHLLPPCEIPDDGKTLLAWQKGKFQAICQDGRTVSVETSKPYDIKLCGPWTIAFPEGWGAPEKIQMNQLSSWTELDMSAEARAFSGTAVYTTDLTVDYIEKNSVFKLDLGKVEVIADVYVNDMFAGKLWTEPYCLDVTELLKKGNNSLTIRVTSSWFNRLAYDAGLPENERKTWTIAGPKTGTSLQDAGLLGPAVLHAGQRLKLNFE